MCCNDDEDDYDSGRDNKQWFVKFHGHSGH